MSLLGDALVESSNEIVDRWMERWRRSSHPHHGLSDAALRDLLATQLEIIGRQIRDLRGAERPEEMWQVTRRLDPEERVGQDVPIEEVVEEYGLAVDTVRDWIEDRDIAVPFEEYSYFYRAIFELTAEAVRRFAKHEAAIVREARARYLAGVMHQLRTPLMAVGMQAELLARRAGTDDEIVARLRRNVARIQHLVESVLRLERFSPSELPVAPEEVLLADLVAAIVSDHQPGADQKGLRIEREIEPDLRITIDPHLTEDAIGNLVQNAVRYTEEGFVRIEAACEAETFVVRVRDSGPGLPEEARSSLFELTRSGSREGAGLGLRIARQAARAQGGDLEVEASDGSGAVFLLRLPRAVAPRGPSQTGAG